MPTRTGDLTPTEIEAEAWKIAQLAAISWSNPDFQGDIESVVRAAREILYTARHSVRVHGRATPDT